MDIIFPTIGNEIQGRDTFNRPFYPFSNNYSGSRSICTMWPTSKNSGKNICFKNDPNTYFKKIKFVGSLQDRADTDFLQILGVHLTQKKCLKNTLKITICVLY